MNNASKCTRENEELWIENVAVLTDCWQEMIPTNRMSRIQRHNALVRLAIVAGVLLAVGLRSFWPLLIALFAIFLSVLTAPDPIPICRPLPTASPSSTSNVFQTNNTPMSFPPSAVNAQPPQPPQPMPMPPSQPLNQPQQPLPFAPMQPNIPNPNPNSNSNPGGNIAQQKSPNASPFPVEPRHLGNADEQDSQRLRGKLGAGSPMTPRKTFKPALQPHSQGRFKFVDYLRKPTRID
jgi:hypothetical protein